MKSDCVGLFGVCRVSKLCRDDVERSSGDAVSNYLYRPQGPMILEKKDQVWGGVGGLGRFRVRVLWFQWVSGCSVETCRFKEFGLVA